jgi:hypothetical protein
MNGPQNARSAILFRLSPSSLPRTAPSPNRTIRMLPLQLDQRLCGKLCQSDLNF